jgi:hypothetical protein
MVAGLISIVLGLYKWRLPIDLAIEFGYKLLTRSPHAGKIAFWHSFGVP